MDLTIIAGNAAIYLEGLKNTVVLVSLSLFVGLMSGQVHRLMADGMAKAQAYSAGFSITVYLAVAFVVVAAILSVVYARHVVKLTRGK